jgi:hypothetical protein
MTHAKQTKESANSFPFISSELQFADFVPLRLVLFFPVEFLYEVIDALRDVISECEDFKVMQ